MIGECNEYVLEHGRDESEIVDLATHASDLSREPAEDSLSLILPNAYVQTIAESLHVLHILIHMCGMTEDMQRLAAQFKDSSCKLRAQIRRCILRDNFSILHEPNTMTA